MIIICFHRWRQRCIAIALIGPTFWRIKIWKKNSDPNLKVLQRVIICVNGFCSIKMLGKFQIISYLKVTQESWKEPTGVTDVDCKGQFQSKYGCKVDMALKENIVEYIREGINVEIACASHDDNDVNISNHSRFCLTLLAFFNSTVHYISHFQFNILL